MERCNAIIVIQRLWRQFISRKCGKCSYLVQNTSIAGAAFVPGAGTAVNSDSTFDGYTLGQIVAILKVHGIVQ